MTLSQCCIDHYFGRPAVISLSKTRDEVVDLQVDWFPEAGPAGAVLTSYWQVFGPPGAQGLTLPSQRLEEDVARCQAAVGTPGNVYVALNTAVVRPGPSGYAYPETLQQQFEVLVRTVPAGVDGAPGPCCPTGPCGCATCQGT